ncbi:MAG: (2Fe-2S)-binding protein, partial [Desulfobacterales bacterium]
MEKQIKFKINNQDVSMAVMPHWTLSYMIRKQLGLTGTKEGCGEGECGSCTVLLEGEPVNSCLLLAVEADGKQICTIEGLSSDGKLHPLQQAFIEKGAIQCGYCTPGMIMTAKAILDKDPNQTTENIKYSMSGNLCRC